MGVPIQYNLLKGLCPYLPQPGCMYVSFCSVEFICVLLNFSEEVDCAICQGKVCTLPCWVDERVQLQHEQQMQTFINQVGVVGYMCFLWQFICEGGMCLLWIIPSLVPDVCKYVGQYLDHLDCDKSTFSQALAHSCTCYTLSRHTPVKHHSDLTMSQTFYKHPTSSISFENFTM